MEFRNLNILPDDPVETWGVEGIATAIDRGSISEWRRIKDAIAADPYGKVSLDTEQAIEITESLGIRAYMRKALEVARQTPAEQLAPLIQEYIRHSGLPRKEIARILGTSRSRLSTYETGKVLCNAWTFHKLQQLAAEH